MDTQIEQAIELAFDPRTDQNLKAQAYEFLNRLREDANGWQVCLAVFVKDPPSSEVVRVVCLELVNNAVQTQGIGQAGLNQVRHQLMDYIRRRYAPNTTQYDPPGIQNKVTQTITYLFTSLYASDWPNFFDEMLALTTASPETGAANPAAILMFLRLLSSIHDEIADLLIPRSREEQKRNNDLKDLVRARDANKISGTWQNILTNWRSTDLLLVEMCLRTIAKWVSWIDISLVINEQIQGALLEIAGQQGSISADSKEAKARDAAIDTFSETVGKKMADNAKIQLIGYLNLANVVGQLVASPALSELQGSAEYDTDLAEAVAKLVNNVVFDVVKVLDSDNVDDSTRTVADQYLQTFVPFVLRFFSDEYDEICSAVIPSLTDMLTMFRKTVKARGSLPENYAVMLQPILDSIIMKMKYDETASWGDEDEQEDEAEFSELRKRLHVLQQTVAAVDEKIYTDTLSNLVGHTLSRLKSPNDKPNWRDLDLALLEMHHFGELAIKNGGIYTKSKPSSEASGRLVEMMTTLVDSDLASYPHPAVQLQYMEVCVRYVQFFEHNTAGTPKVLESFVRLVHSDHDKVRLRAWYLFQRFIRHLRTQLSEYAQTVVQAIADLLTIRAEVPADRDDDDVSSEDNGRSADAVFTSQLYLFEAIGTVASGRQVPTETTAAIARSVIEQLSLDLNNNLVAAKGGDARATLQIHHVIMALGSLAAGSSDWQPGVTSHGSPPAVEVSREFVNASNSILVALENLKNQSDIRAAARHAFSRLLGVLGSQVLPQLPRWIDGLLSSASTNDEMAMFLRTLGQVVYGFKGEIYNILDQLLSPLFQRVFAGFSQPLTGTDDEIQMRELKQQYLGFVLVILNNDLAAVLVSPSNQATFDPFITSITKFSCDPSDPSSARSAFSVLTKLTTIWAGPDVSTEGITPSPSTTDTSPTASAQPLPGFSDFILAQFAPLTWTLVSTPNFNPNDAQMRSVLQEAATLQWTILRKNGAPYRDRLQQELSDLGVSPDGVQGYIRSVSGELLAFKKFFAGFVQQARAQ
ncbi:Xpo1-domain-containing protein [Dissoconium aciculare CBS 342.82]|uniref:Exportin-T n=1 Tax=Dissoconium aciculare CBS 342.82 TaxID=1314786 RepID=A0A6J3MJN1_9PEZI|nr:Xpo1-domain-containing protein [Dissoconium aciculare CBS 342.82]KAF1827964.1 Xpo1-domain-containing protein [Dissoconium aciculare CBS 342.82]